MKSKEELSHLKNNLLEYKRNIKIGAVATAVGAALDVGIANLDVPDLTMLPLMTSLVAVPGIIIYFNASDYKKDKKRINEIEGVKTLKKTKSPTM